MKNSQNEILKRQDKLVQLLKHHERIDTQTLCQLLDTSISTIRRDINELSTKNIVIKGHGYVSFNPSYTPNFDSFGSNNIKEEIAKHSANLINNYDSIFINSSSTALKAINYLSHPNNTIITNNMHIFNYDLDNRKQIIITGGNLRPNKKSLTGNDALNLLQTKRAEVCIMGCYGISFEDGTVFSSVNSESLINEMMVKNTTRTRILLADYRKFGRQGDKAFANISDFDYIISDSYLPNIYLRDIEKYNIRLIQASI